MKCPHCGADTIPDWAKFCPDCGKKLAVETSSLPTPRIIVRSKGEGSIDYAPYYSVLNPIYVAVKIKTGENIFRLSQHPELCRPILYFRNTKSEAIEFINCSELRLHKLMLSSTDIERIDLSFLAQSQLEYMGYMFSKCSRLRELDLSMLNVGKVITLENCFFSCTSLQTLNLSGWNLESVGRNYKQMFSGCTSLRQINVSGCSPFTVDLIETALEEAGLRDVELLR